MNKIAAFFLSIITIITSTLGINPKRPIVEQEQAKNFNPVLRFFVCSDTHIGSATDPKLERIEKAIDFSYNVAQSDEYYKNLDAVVFCGDVTNSGTEEQFKAFESTVKSAVKDYTEILAIVAKGHDSITNGKKSLKYCTEITGKDSDFNVNINGFHFIGLSTSKTENINHNLKQKTWLNKQLRAAKKEDAKKPVFVFHHEHVTGTVYGSSAFEGWGNFAFRSVVMRYPQVVDFSGHSHYPINDPRSIWQGAFTAVGTGSMYYMEFTVGKDKTVHPEDNDKAAQAWIVEVDSDYRIRLRGFDVITGKWLCDYLIKDPTDTSSYAYTPYNQKALSSTPEFDEDSTLSYTENDGKYTVTAPAAKSTDGKIVFLYRVKVMNKAGIVVHSEYKLNNYWTTELYKDISFTVDAKPGYTVSVTAENAYGMSSEPLSIKI